jgi:hypothetical protein
MALISIGKYNFGQFLIVLNIARKSASVILWTMNPALLDLTSKPGRRGFYSS